jgi:hypothetical protein
VYYLVAATPAGSQRRVARRKLCKWNATPCNARPMDEVRRAAITCIHAFRAGNDLPLQSAPRLPLFMHPAALAAAQPERLSAALATRNGRPPGSTCPGRSATLAPNIAKSCDLGRSSRRISGHNPLAQDVRRPRQHADNARGLFLQQLGCLPPKALPLLLRLLDGCRRAATPRTPAAVP